MVLPSLPRFVLSTPQNALQKDMGHNIVSITLEKTDTEYTEIENREA